MKKLLLLPIFCTIILSSCQQKTNEKASKKETTKEIKVEAIENHTINEDTVKGSTLSKTESKIILDTIYGTAVDEDTLKILIYKYLYPDNKKYIRDFDIINSSDSIILSAMQEEYHWKGEITDSDIGEINIIPTYSVLSTEPLNVMFGFYINPYEWDNTQDYVINNGMREYLSYIMSDYQFEDSIMRFFSISFSRTISNSIRFIVKASKDIISVDSINILKATKKRRYMSRITHNTFANFLSDSIPQNECINLIGLDYITDNSSIDVTKYLLFSYTHHHKTTKN